MEMWEGKSICKKVAIGRIYYFEKRKVLIKNENVEDTEAEKEAFIRAKDEAVRQLTMLFEKAKVEVGEAEAAIFEVHIMMLNDQDYQDFVYDIIERQRVGATYAVASAGSNFSEMFERMEDEYMKARAADIRDISERMVQILSGEAAAMYDIQEPVIVVADDLAPSEAIQLDKSKLLGFATRYGSSISHTAILAKTMNIPALMGVDIQKEWHGKIAVLDGCKGRLVIDPDEKTLAMARKTIAEDRKREALLKRLKGKESRTVDGKRIKLCANIGSVADTAAALLNDAEGIGLFRSEFLYLEADDYPTEQEQYIAYKTVAEEMAGRRVIIRTLDTGADKQAPYLGLDKEENPALGYRAIRICLTREEMFKTQLRAILRASVHGRIAVMFPLIISVEEVVRAKEILKLCRQELEEEGIACRDVEIGVMIETPAAVMISEELGKEVDFFSIGTNDLTQYTLAIDRRNPKLEKFYDEHHPAILAMIAKTIENGHKSGAWVGICGELGADLSLTETFLKMGVDELSVSPAAVLPIREKIRSLTMDPHT